MKKILIAILFLIPIVGFCQINQQIEGKISYISSNNIYVKFENTDIIAIGDTLSANVAGSWKPALVVLQKSSSSCITNSIIDFAFGTDDKIKFFIKTEHASPSDLENEKKSNVAVLPDPENSVEIEDKTNNHNNSKTEKLNGRLSISTNSNIMPDNEDNYQRLRTSFSLRYDNIKNSDFSFENYITYRHRYGVDQISDGFYHDFKIYNLCVKYAPANNFSVTLGRKINYNLANMGAIDGLQLEKSLNKFTFGFLAGSRPDFSTYAFNFHLPQFGAYLVRTDSLFNGYMNTTLAFAEQQNNWITDRRFVYLQHSNNIFKNLNIFFSSELDLYKKINDTISNNPALTSLFVSLRYRLNKNLSLSASYDNRRNVIYYESYRTFIDQLIAQETRKGYRLSLNIRPVKRVSINASSFYRYQGIDSKPTKNYIFNINFSNLPFIKSTLSINTNLMETKYLSGIIYGGRLSKNFLKGKLFTELNYRKVNYSFIANENKLKQDIAGFNLSYNLFKYTSIMLSYEGTFETNRAYHLYFITLNQRIKK